MADIHHESSPRGLRAHAIAGIVAGITLLIYGLAMAGQAVGLFGL